MCPDRRKFATQLVKAPLVLALTEAASAHVHACAENMASKSRKGRFAFLQQQESALNIAFCIASAVALLNTKEISPPGHRESGFLLSRACKEVHGCIPTAFCVDVPRKTPRQALYESMRGDRQWQLLCPVRAWVRSDHAGKRKKHALQAGFLPQCFQGRLAKGRMCRRNSVPRETPRQVLCKARSRQGFSIEGSTQTVKGRHRGY